MTKTKLKKTFYILFILVLFINCENETTHGCSGVEEEMEQTTKELNKFEKLIVSYYNSIENNPKKIIIETDSLIQKVKTEADPYNIRWNKLMALYNLRAETFYKTGDYQKSIYEILEDSKNNQETLGGKFYIGDNSSIHLACNYVKLEDYEKAELYLNNASRGWYITDFIIANFNEVIGNKTKAINTYQEIIKEEDMNHYLHYQWSKNRLINIKSVNYKPLTELYYPSNKPNEEITIE